jgi:hypothetical protein
MDRIDERLKKRKRKEKKKKRKEETKEREIQQGAEITPQKKPGKIE